MKPSLLNRRLVALFTLAFVAVLAPCAAWGSKADDVAKKPVRLLITGAEDALWVVRAAEGEKNEKGETDDKFALVVRRPGGKWRTLQRFSGTPASIAATDTRLHLITAAPNPNSTAFSLSSNMQQILHMAPGPQWKLGSPPTAICTTNASGDKSDALGLIAVVPSESDKISTTTAASQPAGKFSKLLILKTDKGKWTQISEIANVPGATGAKISAISTGQWIYILVVPKDAPARLLAWEAKNEKSAWKDITFTDKTQTPLALSVLSGRAVLVTTGQADKINLAIHEIKGDTLTSQPQTITHQGAPLDLPLGTAPLTCSLGKTSESQLILLWKDAEKYHCAFVNLSGEVVQREEVPELTAENSSLDQNIIIEYVLLGITALLLGYILFSPRKQQIGPMILPARFIPGSLPKRFAAMLVDWIPFSVLGLIAIKYTHQDMTIEEIASAMMPTNQENFQVEMLLYMVAAMIAWIIYGAIMECRFGATLGKMLLRLEVTSADGTRPTARQAILRNLIKPIEIQWPICIFTVAIPLMNRTRQRLGDIMARTVVVEKQRAPIDDLQDDGQGPAAEA
ncbi:MAG: RDD family protein [Phycisphaerales bacterium]|jgi:uncharacterized RDD family membrane protein YckC|nr:RDD family protein [Phycisphaerales bacterium]